MTDEFGNELGYDGDEEYHTNCNTVFDEDCGSGDGIAPSCFEFASAYPNPFFQNINLNITTPSSGEIFLKIVDTNMNLIKTIYEGTLDAGYHTFQWDGSTEDGDMLSGEQNIYFRAILSDGNNECYYNIRKEE